MWDITIHPLKEPDDPVGTTGQPVRLALIPNVTARPNLPYIVRFGPYCPHGFVCGDASPLLSLTPQNAYDKLTTSTTNKASNQLLTRRYGILQSTPLMELDDPVGTTRQPMRSALIPNVTARPNLPYIVHFGPYCPYGFIYLLAYIISIYLIICIHKLSDLHLNFLNYRNTLKKTYIYIYI